MFQSAKCSHVSVFPHLRSRCAEGLLHCQIDWFCADIFRISSTIFQESLSYLSIQHSFEIWSQPVRCTSQHSFTWVSHCLQDISASSAILCPHLLLMLAVLHTTKNSSSAYFPKKFYLALSCSPHTSKSSTRRKPLHDNTPFLLSPCSC